jgi:hypothetical protein
MREVKKGKKRKKEKGRQNERTSYTNKNRRTNHKFLWQRSRYSDKPTCWSTDGFLFYSRLGQKIKPTLETTQHPVEWGAGTLSSGIKRPKREANQSRPSFSEDKNERTYTSTPPHAFMACTQTILILSFTRITRNKGTCRCALRSEWWYLNPLLQYVAAGLWQQWLLARMTAAMIRKTCSNEYWLLATTTIDKHGNTSSCVRACLLSTTSVCLKRQLAVWLKNRRTCDVQSNAIEFNRHSASVSVSLLLHCDVTHTVTTKMILLQEIRSFANHSHKPTGRRWQDINTMLLACSYIASWAFSFTSDESTRFTVLTVHD